MKRLGLIGGTGLDRWSDVSNARQLNTVYGEPSAALSEYDLGKIKVFFLPRHGDRHQIPPHAVNYQANIDVFKTLEVDGIVAVNAVGGIRSDLREGMLVIPDQLVDYTWGRAHSFSMDAGTGLLHCEFAHPFNGFVRDTLIRSALLASVDVVDGACIGVTQGPRLETAAEVRRLKHDGCDLVGMTTMPEAALAREAGLDYSSLSIVANPAAGLGDEPLGMAKIEATLDTAMVNVRKLLKRFFEEFSNVR